jgi:uncharacterized protein with von Willebrand factor type A (vWA) domain
VSTYSYSKWDGQDEFGLDKEELMDELSRNLMEDGDLNYSLWKMMNHGGMRGGKPFPSLQELIHRLQNRRQQQLDRFKVDSVMDEIRQKLDDILKTEREGI